MARRRAERRVARRMPRTGAVPKAKQRQGAPLPSPGISLCAILLASAALLQAAFVLSSAFLVFAVANTAEPASSPLSLREALSQVSPVQLKLHEAATLLSFLFNPLLYLPSFLVTAGISLPFAAMVGLILVALLTSIALHALAVRGLLKRRKEGKFLALGLAASYLSFAVLLQLSNVGYPGLFLLTASCYSPLFYFLGHYKNTKNAFS